MALVLCIEDRRDQLTILMKTLEHAGFQALGAEDGNHALELFRAHLPEVVLLDLGLPDEPGMDLIDRFLNTAPSTRIIVLSGRNEVRTAVDALHRGARNYFVKPWDRDELLLAVQREVQESLHVANLARQVSDRFWGTNPEVRSILKKLDRLAASPFTPVLIEGETGTGKEMLAREIYERCRPDGDFVAVNCAAIPRDLLENELFGHEKGAFTGAETRKRGVVELAGNGLLFLDEIATLPLELQAKLLRFLQDGSFRRVGSETESRVRCRVVAATHENLEEARKIGSFRNDLFFRLAVVRFKLPALRERREDILPLTEFLIRQTGHNLGMAPRRISSRARDAILGHDWPGNIRELANRIERAMVLGDDDDIQPGDLDLHHPQEVASSGEAGDLAILFNPARLRKLLENEGWNISAAARRINVDRHRLVYRMKVFGIRRPRG